MRSTCGLILTTACSAILALGPLQANAAPVPLAGGGDTYVFTSIGPWSNEDCIHAQSIDLELEDILAGSLDDADCMESGRIATSSAQVQLQIEPTGFTATFQGSGLAEGEQSFSRHDVTTYVELGFESDTRMRMDWSMETGGLGSGWIRFQRLGDIGGESDPSMPLIDRELSSYITPLMESGSDVLFIPAGRWNLRLVSNHQAAGEWEEGFQHSWAQSIHAATIVALGDVDGDETVGVADLLAVIGDWGQCDADCRPDLDGDGTVGVTDLLQVISDWD